MYKKVDISCAKLRVGDQDWAFLDQADRRAPRDLTARQSAWVASSKRVQGPMVRDPDFRGIIVHHSPNILDLRGIVVMV